MGGANTQAQVDVSGPSYMRVGRGALPTGHLWDIAWLSLQCRELEICVGEASWDTLLCCVLGAPTAHGAQHCYVLSICSCRNGTSGGQAKRHSESSAFQAQQGVITQSPENR